NDVAIESTSLQDRFKSYGPASVQRCENNAKRLAAVQNTWIDNQCVEPLHVSFIDIFPQRRDASLSIFRERFIAFTFNRLHFSNDPARMRLDHLRASSEERRVGKGLSAA